MDMHIGLTIDETQAGRDEFAVDADKQQEDDRRYDEGKGLIGGDPEKHQQAIEAAQRAVQARLDFWDGVHQALQAQDAA